MFDCTTDEDGVLRTFAPANVPFSLEETAVNIRRHFRLTASTTASPAYPETTSEVTTALPTAGADSVSGKIWCID